MLHAEVFAPQQRSRRDEELKKTLTWWEADFVIRIDSQEKIRAAAGDDALQAILLAVEAIRMVIPDGEEADWVSPSGVPSWIIFPRSIPIGWGKDFYDLVARMVDNEERKLQQQIEDRRSVPGPGKISGSK